MRDDWGSTTESEAGAFEAHHADPPERPTWDELVCEHGRDIDKPCNRCKP